MSGGHGAKRLLGLSVWAHACFRGQQPCGVQLPSRNVEIELTTVSSNYHVEMNPSDVGYQDRYVVQEIIKVRPE